MKTIPAALAAALLALAAGPLPAAGTPKVQPWGVDFPGMDRAVKPGDDFWAFANGSWNRATPFAPDRGSAGVGIQLTDQAEVDVRQIVEGLAADPHAAGTDRKVGDLYAA